LISEPVEFHQVFSQQVLDNLPEKTSSTK